MLIDFRERGKEEGSDWGVQEEGEKERKGGQRRAERERETDRQTSKVASCLGMEPQPFGVLDNVPTNWATQPGQSSCLLICCQVVIYLCQESDGLLGLQWFFKLLLLFCFRLWGYITQLSRLCAKSSGWTWRQGLNLKFLSRLYSHHMPRDLRQNEWSKFLWVLLWIKYFVQGLKDTYFNFLLLFTFWFWETV